MQGDDDPIHKAKAGGWSQKRYQQRAENTWKANAALTKANAHAGGSRVRYEAHDER